MQHTRRTFTAACSVLLVVVAVAGIYGCRTLATIEYSNTETPTPGATQPVVEGTGGGAQTDPAPIDYTRRESGVQVGPLEPVGVLAVSAFWPTADRTDAFLRQDAGEKKSVAIVRVISVLPNGEVGIVRTGPPERTAQGGTEGAGGAADGSDDGQALSTTRLALTDTGEVVVRFNEASKIESTFDPAMLFLPEALAAGDEIERPFTVDAVGPRFGTGVGEGSVTVRGLGTQSVRTPGGDFICFVLETESSFKIGPATIKRARHAWIPLSGTGSGAGLGIIAEESSQTVKVFGISVSSKAWVSVLAPGLGATETP